MFYEYCLEVWCLGLVVCTHTHEHIIQTHIQNFHSMVLLTCLCRKSLHFAGNIQYPGIRRECIEKNDKKRFRLTKPRYTIFNNTFEMKNR